MELKKTMFKLKATMVAVLMATSSSINAIDADVKTDLLARYPNMNTLSDAQLQKVVNLFHRFPGLKNLNQKDIDSIKDRIEDRRASGNRVLGSGKVVKKLIEIKPELLANIDPNRFRMRLSRSANGSLSIKENLTTQFENMSKDEMKEQWSQMPIMEKISVLKAFREKVQEIRADGDWETNRELLVNYVYENKLTDDEKQSWDKNYSPDWKAQSILNDLTGNGNKEPNWKMFWMLPPETRRDVYSNLEPKGGHFDDFTNPDAHGSNKGHTNCNHAKNKFWNAFSEQYPRIWEGWFKDNIWDENNAGIEIPKPDPSNFPSDELKDHLKDFIKNRLGWPPLPPDKEILFDNLLTLIEYHKPGWGLVDEGPVVGNELLDPDKQPGWGLVDEGPVVGNELPDPPPTERPISILDKDKVEELINYLKNRPGWEPLPPMLDANMDDIIVILQQYQRAQIPNAEELLRRSKKTPAGS